MRLLFFHSALFNSKKSDKTNELKKGNNLPLHQIDPQPKQTSQIVQKTQILNIKDSFII